MLYCVKISRENYMLIRLVIENWYSFGKRIEFNTIPGNRYKRNNHHKYTSNNVEVLKLTSIYGANGAGKSNLIKVLRVLQNIIVNGKLPDYLNQTKFKLNNNDKSQLIGIEFINNNSIYYYGIETLNNTIIAEELYQLSSNNENSILIFERIIENNKIKLKFSEELEQDKKSTLFKEILIEDFLKPNKTIFTILAKRNNKNLKQLKNAFRWFEDSLTIIHPNTKPRALALLLERNHKFKDYAEDLMRSFNTGIKTILSEKHDLKTYFGLNDKKLIESIESKFKNKKLKTLSYFSESSEELLIIKENDNLFVYKVNFEHIGNDEKPFKFDMINESDGTKRLLDYLPAFFNLINSSTVFIIDEIERSIHPTLIKELLRKFSTDPKTKGQLIFTTHETNLLDQSIFRQDEIWFIEKDQLGNSEMYSLSDYKEHNTTDIRRGYLNGRYGSIPFLGNLQDLNWNKYADS